MIILLCDSVREKDKKMQQTWGTKMFTVCT